jgi:hypothetical protein
MDLSAIPITECGFPKRLIMGLQKCGAETLLDASKVSIPELLRIPNVGRGSAAHLEAVLGFLRTFVIMSEDERILLERTKRFVAATCPKLSENERDLVVAKVYSEMKFTLKLVKT